MITLLVIIALITTLLIIHNKKYNWDSSDLLFLVGGIVGFNAVIIIVLIIAGYSSKQLELNKAKLDLEYWKAFSYTDESIRKIGNNFEHLIKIKSENDTFLYDSFCPDEIEIIYTMYKKEIDQIKLMGK